MLSLGILSWRAHDTLRRTLTSYGHIIPLVDEAVIYFNDITDEDRAIANEFGLRAEGGARNLGILGGTRALVASLRGDKVILAQNDNPVCVPPDVLARRVAAARALLDDDIADLVRLGNRFGDGFSDRYKYLRYWPDECGSMSVIVRLRRILRPFKARRMAGRAPAVLTDPTLVHPSLFTRAGDAFIADSSVVDYTDQPFMASRALVENLLEWAYANQRGFSTLNGMAVPEIVLNSSGHWRKRHLRVAVTDGVFAHARFDGSFRS